MKDVLLLVNIHLQHELNLTWPTPAWGANSASDLLAFVAPAGRLHKGADRKVRPLAFRLAKRRTRRSLLFLYRCYEAPHNFFIGTVSLVVKLEEYHEP